MSWQPATMQLPMQHFPPTQHLDLKTLLKENHTNFRTLLAATVVSVVILRTGCTAVKHFDYSVGWPYANNSQVSFQGRRINVDVTAQN